MKFLWISFEEIGVASYAQTISRDRYAIDQIEPSTRPLLLSARSYNAGYRLKRRLKPTQHSIVKSQPNLLIQKFTLLKSTCPTHGGIQMLPESGKK